MYLYQSNIIWNGEIVSDYTATDDDSKYITIPAVAWIYSIDIFPGIRGINPGAKFNNTASVVAVIFFR